MSSGKTVGYSVWQKKAVTRWHLNLTSFQVDRLCWLWFGIGFAVFNVVFWIYFSIASYDKKFN